MCVAEYEKKAGRLNVSRGNGWLFKVEQTTIRDVSFRFIPPLIPFRSLRDNRKICMTSQCVKHWWDFEGRFEGRKFNSHPAEMDGAISSGGKAVEKLRRDNALFAGDNEIT